MSVLVTGAAGFVGSNLVRYLVSENVSVRAMVRKSSDIEKMRGFGAEAVIGDITDPESLAVAVKGVDHVFHIAAIFRQANLPVSEFFRINVEGTRAVLEACMREGVRGITYCSTTGVMNIKNPPADETAPYAPTDPYQESKMEGEKLFLDYVRTGKIRGNVIRPAMIWGPDDTRLLKLFERVKKGTFFYVGDGSTLVHFIDVRDLARAFYLVSQKPEVNGEIFIIAGQRTLSLKSAINMIAKRLGVKEPWLHLPVKPMQWAGSLCEWVCAPFGINPPIYRRRVDFFTKHRSFDCRKAREMLGFTPSQSLEKEIDDIVRANF